MNETSDLSERILAYLQWLSAYLPGFAHACLIALQIAFATILLSWLCGLVGALAKTSSYRLLRWPAEFYIWFMRGTPTLIQIFIVYFGLPQMGMRLSPFVAGVIALGLSSGAYVAEIVRAGLKAIPRGQFESAQALGMSYSQTMRDIILPQVTRIIVPALTNEAINTLKNTSLLSTITVVELTLYTQTLIAATFKPFDFYIVAALLYLLMTTLLSWFANWFEKRNAFYH
ncbi:MAG: amino acid ABC transporter permease [Gammaproteobacteria bacterium]